MALGLLRPVHLQLQKAAARHRPVRAQDSQISQHQTQGPRQGTVPLFNRVPCCFLLISTRSSARSKAIEGLGQHGLVGTSDENLMNLHDALKVEFHRVVQSYKVALSKLEVNSLLAAGLVGVVHWLHSSLSAPSGTGPGAQEDGGAHRVVGTGAGAGVAPASAVAQTGSISCCRCR